MEHFTGTKVMADSHAFNIQALQAHLQQHLPGFAGPLLVEQFKGGQSNPTYKLITPGAAYVMRSKPGPAAKLQYSGANCVGFQAPRRPARDHRTAD